MLVRARRVQGDGGERRGLLTLARAVCERATLTGDGHTLPRLPLSLRASAPGLSAALSSVSHHHLLQTWLSLVHSASSHILHYNPYTIQACLYRIQHCVSPDASSCKVGAPSPSRLGQAQTQRVVRRRVTFHLFKPFVLEIPLSALSYMCRNPVSRLREYRLNVSQCKYRPARSSFL
ncbi:hypothetical protein BD309DRAFT_150237 [Dichomitus squalens]|nr:hypothetical protein BD309DRAFT_150237 [Dichomitus squalens]